MVCKMDAVELEIKSLICMTLNHEQFAMFTQYDVDSHLFWDSLSLHIEVHIENIYNMLYYTLRLVANKYGR